MNPRPFLLFPFSLMLILASCIMLPIPTQEDKILAGKPVNEEQLSFLRPEVTTREEVIERFGNPNIIWEDAQAFVYNWDMRQGILFWAVGAYYTGGAGMKDLPKHYALIIRFNEEGRVVEFTKKTRSSLQSCADFLTEWRKTSFGQFPTEQGDVRIEEKAIVLLNVQCTVDNQPYESFIKWTFTTSPIFFFGLGSFETVGEPRPIDHRFFSEESRRAGWTYFTLSPGIYYLAVLGPYTRSRGETDYQEAPRWRIDIPEKAKAVYVGTLQVAGKSDGELLFGDKIIVPAGNDEPAIRDDHTLASGLISKHFLDAGEPKTILMQRWHPGDPIRIRSPRQSSGGNSDTRKQ